MNRAELRKELNKVYPFNEREHHPYKIWLAVVNEALDSVFGCKQTDITQLPLLSELND